MAKCGVVYVLSKRGGSHVYIALDVLVSPKLFDRQGCFGMAFAASMHQRRYPILTHTHEREQHETGGEELILGH